jgi:hypothetical protein
MTPFLTAYLIAWIALTLIALAMLAWQPARYSLLGPGYRRFLATPWKLVTFLIAGTAITVVAPYTGDPTWDYYGGALMSVLTFATAPWAVGTLYLAARGQAGLRQAYVAAILWMLSSSWCYDGYLLWRDGEYPSTWLPNIPASGVLYCSAGLMWNLDWRAGRGVTFSFQEGGWPDVAPSNAFLKVLGYALPFMAMAAYAVVYFFLPSD